MKLKLVLASASLSVAAFMGQGVFAMIRPVPPINMEAARAVNNGIRRLPDTTPLIDAVRAGNVAAVRAMLDRGEEANAGNSYSETPLLLAMIRNDADMVMALLEGGAYSDYWDNPGQRTPLNLFLHGGCVDFGDKHDEIMGLLLAHRQPLEVGQHPRVQEG